jgi:ABC-type multidrug transport system fused ATPase/permease subunit
MLCVYTAQIVNELGWIGMITPVVVGVCTVAQKYFGKQWEKIISTKRRSMDIRSKEVNEMVQGAKATKLNAWEKFIFDRICKIREGELTLLRRVFKLIGFSNGSIQIAPPLCAVISFIIYNTTNDVPLSVPSTYSLLILFNLIVAPLSVLSNGITSYSKGKVALARMKKFLKVQDYDKPKDDQSLAKGSLEISGANYSWEDNRFKHMFDKVEPKVKKPDLIYLKNIDFKAEAGSFSAILGQVGCGKTSLLLAMLNELNMVTGTSKKNGRFAYISQTPYLKNDTVRNNICFGLPYVEEKFEKVLDICQLRPDLATFEAGDLQEIGQRGINLSGGQK